MHLKFNSKFTINLILKKYKRFIFLFFILLFIILLLHSGLKSIKEANKNNKSNNNNLIKKKRETKNNRILCYIILGSKHITAAKVINETWGTKCDKLLFFGGFSSSLNLNITYINAPEGYEFLWQKTIAALLYLEDFNKEFEWFIKADHDTFVVIENLKLLTETLDYDSPIWFGYRLKHRLMKQIGYQSGGAGYVMSRESLSRVVKTIKGKRSNEKIPRLCNINKKIGSEDVELGKCFIEAGVKTINTFDNENKQRFLPISLTTLLNKKVSYFHWIWYQSYWPVNEGKECCSSQLISIHETSPEEMRLIYFLIYTLKINKI